MHTTEYNTPDRNSWNASNRAGRFQAAFTLLELLVVIAIIGLLAGITLPSLKNMTKSNSMIAANRQLLDDIAYARQRAIADHTTVYLVFIPPYVIGYTPPGSETNPVALKQFTNLYGGQFTTYALLSLRSVGEQPGRSTPHYLSNWRSLPNGVFIATNKFTNFSLSVPNTVRGFALTNSFPFPLATNTVTGSVVLPYVGFDYLGRLVTAQDEYIPLARGSIFYARDGSGNFINQPADVAESPLNNSVNNSNVIHIDWITGHARVERQEVQ